MKKLKDFKTFETTDGDMNNTGNKAAVDELVVKPMNGKGESMEAETATNSNILESTKKKKKKPRQKDKHNKKSENHNVAALPEVVSRIESGTDFHFRARNPFAPLSVLLMLFILLQATSMLGVLADELETG